MAVLVGSLVNTANVADGDISTLELSGAEGIASLLIDGRTFVYVTGQSDDGFSIFELTEAGALIHVADVADDSSFNLNGARGIATTTVNSNRYLYVAGFYDDGISAFSLGLDGTPTSIADYGDTGTRKLDGASGLTVATVGSTKFLIASGLLDDGLSVFQINSNGTLTDTDTFGNGPIVLNGLDNPLGLATLNITGGTLVFAASAASDSIVSFGLDGTGDLTALDTVFDSEDPALQLDGVWDVAAAEIAGTAYVFAAGQADDGISVFSVNSGGALTNVFNLADNGTLGLNGARGIETFQFAGETFLSVTSEFDDALGLFHVAANGSLTEIDTVFEQDNPTAFELDGARLPHFVMAGATPFLLATGSGDNGVSVFEIGGGNDTLTGGANNDTLFGLGGNDILIGGLGTDVLSGGEGDDILNGGPGADSLIGGPGIDIATYTDASAFVVADLTYLLPSKGDAQGDSFLGITGLEGSSFNDRLVGDAFANFLSGLDGDDTLEGGGGNDHIVGGAGNDFLTGGSGFDWIEGGDGNDYLAGASDNDTLTGGNGDDEFVGGSGGDTINGGSGSDTASYFDSAAINIQLQYNIASGGEAQGDTLISIENIFGSNSDDTITGNAQANRLEGSIGNDRLKGLGGADELIGGYGDDWLYVDNLDTKATGGSGTDRLIVVSAGGVTNAIGTNGIEIATGNAGNDRFYGGVSTANLTVKGLGGDDIINGGAGDDFIYGGSGADQLRGGAGLDRLYVDENDTLIDGGTGTQDRVIVQQLATATSGVTLDMAASRVEVAYGNVHDDTFDGSAATVALSLYGRNGQDTLIGGTANDRLYGDNNDAATGDSLNGGGGNDYLYGGTNTGGWAERDQFIFDADWGNDRIFDFADNGAEKIDFSSIAGITQRSDLGFADVTDSSGTYALVTYTDGGGWTGTIRVYDVAAAQLQDNDFIYT